MSRKTNYLQLTETKDRNAYELLINCRHVLPEHLQSVGVSKNRIENYKKEKLIERVDVQDRYVYRLTDKGYKQFEKQLGTEHFRYHSQSIEHDISLSQKYIDVLREHSNMIWKNEEDLKHERLIIVSELRERGEFERAECLSCASVPDCIITTDIEFGFDVITDNYSNAIIESKSIFCSELGCDFKFEKI